MSNQSVGKNRGLNSAKEKKEDHYYTRYEDIEKELSNYSTFFKDKIIYCNCDNYLESNFVKYFKDNFTRFGLKKLISTCYNGLEEIVQLSLFDEITEEQPPYYYEYDGKEEMVSSLNGNGSFDSKECIEILKHTDIVVTNPPFSLWRKFWSILLKYKKDFIIIGLNQAVYYKDVFSHIRDRKILLGVNLPSWFKDKSNEIVHIECYWYTTLDSGKIPLPIPLTEKYSPQKYPNYLTINAIEVSKIKDIPKDYFGLMGVPITFLPKWNPNQFKIVTIYDDNLTDIKAIENYLLPIDLTKFVEYYPNGTPTKRDPKRHQYCPIISYNEKDSGCYIENKDTREKYKFLIPRILIQRIN